MRVSYEVDAFCNVFVTNCIKFVTNFCIEIYFAFCVFNASESGLLLVVILKRNLVIMRASVKIMNHKVYATVVKLSNKKHSYTGQLAVKCITAFK